MIGMDREVLEGLCRQHALQPGGVDLAAAAIQRREERYGIHEELGTRHYRSAIDALRAYRAGRKGVL